jgi:hypothetical protein
MKKILIIIVALFFSGCISQKEENINTQINEKISEEQIAFLTFKICNNVEKNINEIQLLNKKIVAGNLKKGGEEAINYVNYLEFQIYNNGEYVNSIKIEHPLYKFVEYFDDMEFHSKIIEQKEQEFFIRLSIKSSSTKIIIKEKIKDNKLNELLTINL